MSTEEQQKQEPRASSALLAAAKATLAELRNHHLCFSSEDSLGEAVAVEEAIARAEKAEAELSTPPQPNHASDDLHLSGWLQRKFEGSLEDLEDVVELLVRRELARGAK